MNEHTAALVSQLAAKLGTTSEFLWATLLKQAQVSIYITLVEYALTAVVVALMWKFRAQIRHGYVELLDSHTTDFFAFIGGIIFVIFVIIWMVAMLIGLEMMITAIVNPEYWALDKILSAIKRK